MSLLYTTCFYTSPLNFPAPHKILVWSPIRLQSPVALINPATRNSTYPSFSVWAVHHRHGLKDNPSASIISILLQSHTCSFISRTIARMVSSAAGRAQSPTSLSCVPRCGPLPHPLSAGNYTHLKPITTSKGTGTGKRSGVFPLVPCSMPLCCTCFLSQEIINNGKFIRLSTNSTCRRSSRGPLV